MKEHAHCLNYLYTLEIKMLSKSHINAHELAQPDNDAVHKIGNTAVSIQSVWICCTLPDLLLEKYVHFTVAV